MGAASGVRAGLYSQALRTAPDWPRERAVFLPQYRVVCVGALRFKRRDQQLVRVSQRARWRRERNVCVCFLTARTCRRASARLSVSSSCSPYRITAPPSMSNGRCRLSTVCPMRTSTYLPASSGGSGVMQSAFVRLLHVCVCMAERTHELAEPPGDRCFSRGDFEVGGLDRSA